MVAVNQQQSSSKWQVFIQAIKDLDFVTDSFTWLFRLMAVIAEPFMALSTIYVIIEAGVPAISVGWLHWTAVGIMISAPEVILPGGFILASELHMQGNKHAWVQYTMCWIFVVLTAGTLADLFIWHFVGAAFSVLLWARCASAVGYSILFRVITHHREVEVVPVADVFARFQEFTDLLQSLSQRQETVSQPAPVDYAKLAEYAQIPVQKLTHISREIETKLSAIPTEITAKMQGQISPKTSEHFGDFWGGNLAENCFTFSEDCGAKVEEISREGEQCETLLEAGSDGGNGRKYFVTFEAASEITGLTIPQLKRRVNAGEIEANSHGKVKVSSLTKWQENRRKK